MVPNIKRIEVRPLVFYCPNRGITRRSKEREVLFDATRVRNRNHDREHDREGKGHGDASRRLKSAFLFGALENNYSDKRSHTESENHGKEEQRREGKERVCVRPEEHQRAKGRESSGRRHAIALYHENVSRACRAL